MIEEYDEREEINKFQKSKNQNTVKTCILFLKREKRREFLKLLFLLSFNMYVEKNNGLAFEDMPLFLFTIFSWTGAFINKNSLPGVWH